MRRAAGPGGERGLQLGEVVGVVDVEDERRDLLHAPGGAGGRGQALVALTAAGPERRRDDPGGVRTRAFVPRPVAVGDDDDLGLERMERVRDSSASSSLGSSAGVSPGTSSTRSAPWATAQSTPRTAASAWPASSGSGIASAPWPKASAVADDSPVTTTTASTDLAGAAR